jgi:hypothetical protein
VSRTSVGMSADAARMSACATSRSPTTCEKAGLAQLNSIHPSAILALWCQGCFQTSGSRPIRSVTAGGMPSGETGPFIRFPIFGAAAILVTGTMGSLRMGAPQDFELSGLKFARARERTYG